MILFTGGFPFTGKSEFVRLLTEQLNCEYVIIEPKEYYPQGYDKLPKDKQTKIATAAWEVCIEQVEKLIKSTPQSKVIIFDTTAKRLHHMRPLFVNARVRHHKIFYIIVAAAMTECADRAGTKWEDKFEDDYANSFDITIPALRHLSDVFKIIPNHNDPDRTALREAAQDITQQILEVNGAVA